MPFNIGVLQGSCVSSDDFAKELRLVSSARDLQIVLSVGEPRCLAVPDYWTVSRRKSSKILDFFLKSSLYAGGHRFS